jgi:dihydropteroate synthase
MPDSFSKFLEPEKYSIRFGSELVILDKPRVMGILNLTPDSFYSESRSESEAALFFSAEKMVQEGATFLDLGGYSTRPGASEVSEKEEMDRVLPYFEKLKKEFPGIYLSIDTYRPEVGRKALETGADWINDVSGGIENKGMWSLAAEKKVPYILMHNRGGIKKFHQPQTYSDVALEVCEEISFQLAEARKFGIVDVIVDPGFGFSKSGIQNFHLLNHLEQVHRLKSPVLVGISRKSMIYKTLEIQAEDALSGTIALNTIALLKGAHILRVHDVKPAIQTINLLNTLCLPE